MKILRVLTACRKVTAGESKHRLTERRWKDRLARALIAERTARNQQASSIAYCSSACRR